MIRQIIPILLLLSIDLYFFQSIKTVGVDLGQKWRIVLFSAYWLVSFVTIVTIYLAGSGTIASNNLRYYGFSIVLIILIPKLIGVLFLLGEDVFRFGEGLIGLFDSSDAPFLHSRRKFISQTGMVISAIPFTAMLYGMMKTAFDFTVRKHSVSSKHLQKAFHGLKIVQISDLHSGSFASKGVVSKAMNLIMEQKPDIIFFTGDLVNNKASEAELFMDEFRILRAPLGVYSILGNHDYGDYLQWPSQREKSENLKRLKSIQAEVGWDLLVNESRIIEKDGEQLALIGVENWGASRHFPKYGDLNKAVRRVEQVPFKILLSHDPSHWKAQVLEHPQRFDLTLSGHTHGFQFGIDIPGFKWSPVQYVYKQWAGLYKEQDQHLYVNRGLGFIGYMGRVGISPEITVIELLSEQNA